MGAGYRGFPAGGTAVALAAKSRDGRAKMTPTQTPPNTTEQTPQVEILPHGPDGIALRLGLTPDAATLAAVGLLRQALETKAPQGVTEIAGSLTSVFLRFDPGRTTRAALVDLARQIADQTDLARATLPPPVRRWTIPVSLGGDHGPQFTDAARAAGLTESAARDVILSTPLRVLTIGFAPGLPYMGLLPPDWDIPRLSQITPNVPRGALVTAVRQLIVFTNPTPTGWLQIGQTAFLGFDPDRSPAMPLRAGDEIRFAPATPSEIEALLADNSGGLGGARQEDLA
jgi:KipI family sensor histidine kinase inhibitor